MSSDVANAIDERNTSVIQNGILFLIYFGQEQERIETGRIQHPRFYGYRHLAADLIGVGADEIANQPQDSRNSEATLIPFDEWLTSLPDRYRNGNDLPQVSSDWYENELQFFATKADVVALNEIRSRLGYWDAFRLVVFLEK